MAKLADVIELLAPSDIDFLTSLPFIPSNCQLKEVNHFYQHSKGRLIKIKIASKPENFSQLKEWIDYRKSINKPVQAYLTKVEGKYFIKLRAEDLQDYVYINIECKQVYVAKNTVIRGQFASFLRYLLYYSGYELKYEKAGKAKSFKPAKTKQIGLEVCSYG